MAEPSESSCCPPGSIGAPPQFTEDPKGTFVTLGSTNTPCYYAAPPAESSFGILMYPDVWGFQSRSTRIADWLSQEGNFHVLLCDCFHGETKADHPDLAKWLGGFPYDEKVGKDTQTAVEFLNNEKKVTEIGVMGFCWGAWAIGKSFQAGFPWKVAVAAHPSFNVEKFVHGGDDVALMQGIGCPTLLMPASNDLPYTKPGSSEFQVLQDRGGRSVVFEDMLHGWTTRGDMNDPNVKRDVEAALMEALQFFKSHLK